MLSRTSILVALVSSLAVIGPAAAQDRAITFSVRGGGYNSLTDLNDPGDADFRKTGYNVGAAVGVRLNRYVGLRGDATFGRNELRAEGVDTGNELSRIFYNAAVQVQYPTASGLEPYAFVGAGGVTLHEVGTDENHSKLAGTFGIGLHYAIPRTRLGVFLEGQGWVYGLSGLNGSLSAYDKTQLETGWSGGFSYSLPF
jgi:opacity protein-like surface antigen